MKKKKKYRTGSGTHGNAVKNYLPDPLEANAQNQIMLAEAELDATQDPFVIGTKLAAQYVPQIAGMFSPGGGMIKAMYGKGESEQVNVEKGEVVSDPTQGSVEMDGPTHDGGGTNLEVSSEADIFSDQVRNAKGVSMAKKEKKRKKTMQDLVKMIDEDSLDKPRKNAYKRKIKQLEAEKQKDLQVQEQAGMFAELLGLNHTGEDGYAKYGKKKYSTGKTGRESFLDVLNLGLNNTEDAFSNKAKTDMGEAYNEKLKLDTAAPDLGEGYNRGFVEGSTPIEESDSSTPMSSFGDMTYGDMVKLAGNAYGAYAQLENTQANRAGDTPHKNEYRDVGREAIATLEGSKGDLNAMKANQESRIRRDAQSNKRQARSSSRGINTMRATDAVSNMQVMDMERALFDSVSGQKMKIDQGIAQTQMGASQAKAQGALMARDNNDRDRDTYYTNLGIAKSNISNAMQQTGKDINQIIKNPVMLELMQNFSKYFNVSSEGVITQKPQQENG